MGDTKYLGVILNPDENTTVENYYESSQFLDFMEQVKIWQENNLISPDPMSNDQATLYNLQYGIVDGTPGYSWSVDEFCYEANIQQNFNGNRLAHRLVNATLRLVPCRLICGTSLPLQRILKRLSLC